MVPEEIKVKKETDIGIRLSVLRDQLLAIRKEYDIKLKVITDELSDLQEDYARAQAQENYRMAKKSWFKWFKRKKG